MRGSGTERGAVDALADADDGVLEATAAREIDLRHRLAELGYGPLERAKLTHIEQRELIEGSVRAERREIKREVRMRGGKPDKQQAKEQRDQEMVSDLQAEIDAIQRGDQST